MTAEQRYQSVPQADDGRVQHFGPYDSSDTDRSTSNSSDFVEVPTPSQSSVSRSSSMNSSAGSSSQQGTAGAPDSPAETSAEDQDRGRDLERGPHKPLDSGVLDSAMLYACAIMLALVVFSIVLAITAIVLAAALFYYIKLAIWVMSVIRWLWKFFGL